MAGQDVLAVGAAFKDFPLFAIAAMAAATTSPRVAPDRFPSNVIVENLPPLVNIASKKPELVQWAVESVGFENSLVSTVLLNTSRHDSSLTSAELKWIEGVAPGLGSYIDFSSGNLIDLSSFDGRIPVGGEPGDPCKHHSEMSPVLQSRNVTKSGNASKAFEPVDPIYRRAEKPCGV